MSDFLQWLRQRANTPRAKSTVGRAAEAAAMASGESTELAALRADLALQTRAVADVEQRLGEALALQADLARELHHRVKNNLQIVISLLTLQARRVEDPAARHVLDQARVRIHAIALVHRLLYEDGETDEINARLLTQRLCHELHANFGNRPAIELACDADDFAIPVPVAMPFTLLIVELVSNALRYAFADGRGGRVMVLLRQQPDGAHLSITDDGIGCASLPNPTGSGIHLAQAFAGQLGGELNLACQIEAGVQANVDLHWPLPATAA